MKNKQFRKSIYLYYLSIKLFNNDYISNDFNLQDFELFQTIALRHLKELQEGVECL